MDFIYPWTLSIHGLYLSIDFIYPWTLSIHGLYLSMDFIYPRTLSIHGLYLSMDFIYPWTLSIHGLYLLMDFIYPWTLFIHGLYLSIAMHLRMYDIASSIHKHCTYFHIILCILSSLESIVFLISLAFPFVTSRFSLIKIIS